MSLKPLDLAVFVSYMLLLIGVGVWFARQQKGLRSYLLADQNVHWIIVAITGWPLGLSVLLAGLAATLYTTLGGMKAVIWTDSIQFLVLCGGIALILGFALAEIPGGLPAAWELAAAKGRTQLLHLEPD